MMMRITALAVMLSVGLASAQESESTRSLKDDLKVIADQLNASKPEEAIEYGRRRIASLSGADFVDVLHRAQLRNRVASVQVNLFRLDEARQNYAKSAADLGTLEADQLPPEERKQHLTASNIVAFQTAYIAMLGDDYLTAEAKFRELARAKRAENALLASRCDREMAKIAVYRGDFARAEELLQSVEKTIANQGDHTDQLAAHSIRGLLYMATQRFEEAESAFEQSYQLSVKHFGPLKQATGTQLSSAAHARLQRGIAAKDEALLRRALADFEKAQECFQAGGARAGYGATNLAAGLRALGMRDEAEQKYREGEATFKSVYKDKPDHPELASLRIKYATLLADRDRLAESCELMTLARKSLRSHAVDVLSLSGEPQQIDFLQRKDKRWLHACLSLATRNPEDPVVARASAEWVANGKGVLLPLMAQRSAALAGMEGAGKLLDLRRQVADFWLKDPADPDNMAKLEALCREERDESADLAFQLAQRRAAGKPDWVTANQIADSLGRNECFIDIVRVDRLDLADPGIDWKRLGTDYVAWVIQPNRAIRVVRLGDADAIDRMARSIVKRITDDGGVGLPEGVKSPADKNEGKAEAELIVELDKLSQVLFKDLLPHLKGFSSWVVSPDGALWSLPWCALRYDEKYVVESHAVSLVLCGRDVVAPADRAAVEWTAPVIMADVAYGAGKFIGPLEYSLVESNEAKPLLGKWAGKEAVQFHGEEATEEAFHSLRKPRAILLSTHGKFTRTHQKFVPNPLLRGVLFFAGANKRNGGNPANDGFLYGFEILHGGPKRSRADLDGTDLVVLSACETAVGDVLKPTEEGANAAFTAEVSEGTVSLQYAFHLAGVRSVVGTLWEVSDETTAELTRDLFTALAEGKSKAVALQLAQKQLIRSRRADPTKKGAAHPYFWSGLILTQKS